MNARYVDSLVFDMARVSPNASERARFLSSRSERLLVDDHRRWEFDRLLPSVKGSVMELSCPSCQQRIEVNDDAATDAGPFLGSTIAEVDCPNCGSVPLPQDADATLTYMQEQAPPELRQIGHFKLVRMLGAGAFGAVWLAEDETLGRQVAIKLQLSSEQDVDSLLHEAHTAAGLDHPNIVSIYEVGRDGGRVFVASQYLDGLTLQNFLSQGKPPVKRACELAATVARALHYAHGKGVIHRDIKPANIILDADGQPCVADFGLAKRLSTTQTISFEGQVLGTARYMSPEQAAGKTQATDHRSDLYSLGVCLFQMLTGHLPFRGNVQAVLHQKMFEDAPSPRTLATTLPRDLETICLKCLERDPTRRYETTEELAEELERYLNGEPIKARPITSVERAWRWCQRRPAVSGLAAGLFLSLSIGLAAVSHYWQQAERSDAFTRKALYRSQMNLAAEYLDRSDIDALRQSLGRFSSDDRMAAQRGFEWNYFDGITRTVTQSMNHGAPVIDVAISEDATQLASVGDDRSIRRWDAATGKLIATLTLPSGRHLCVDFVPTTNHLVAGASDGMVRVWNAAGESRPVAQFKHGPPVKFVRVSDDGSWLLTSGRKGAVRIWDLSTEKMLTELPTGQGETLDVQFSPRKTEVFVAKEDGRVRILSTGSPSFSRIMEHGQQLEVLAVAPDGGVLATGSYGGQVRVWSLGDQSELRTIKTNLGIIGELVFLRSGRLAAVGVNGRLTVINTLSGRVLAELPTHALSEGALDLSAKTGTLVVGSGDGSVRVIDQEKLLSRRILWHSAAVRSLQFSVDGQSLLAADEDGEIRHWNVTGSTDEPVLRSGDGDAAPPEASSSDNPGRQVTAFQPGGELVAVGHGNQLTLRHLTTGEVQHERTWQAGRIVRLEFSPDGQRLLLVSDSNVALVAPIDDGPAHELQPGGEQESRITAVIWAADGRSLTLATDAGEFWSWALENPDGKARQLPLQTDEEPTALAWCGDGKTLAIGTATGRLVLIDPVAAEDRVEIKAHSGQINALAVFPDGQTIVSGGRDRALKLWDVSSGERLTTLQGHGRQIFAIAISSDGDAIVSGSLAGDIRLWPGATP
jgi:WD40 repeat protein/serine/threonine protein kinase